MEKILLAAVICSLFLLAEPAAQIRRETDPLRNRDISRQREQPTQQEHKRPIDEGGKIRETPRPDPPPQRSDPPQREPVRYKDNVTPQPENPKPEVVYIETYYSVPDYFYSSDFYESEPEVIYTSYKQEALNYLKAGKYEAAIKKLNSSIAENTKDLELYFLRGIAKTGAEYYDDAVEDFDYYLKFFDEDGDGYYRRGLAKFLDHDKEEAQKDFIIASDLKCPKAKQILKKYF